MVLSLFGAGNCDDTFFSDVSAVLFADIVECPGIHKNVILNDECYYTMSMLWRRRKNGCFYCCEAYMRKLFSLKLLEMMNVE